MWHKWAINQADGGAAPSVGFCLSWKGVGTGGMRPPTPISAESDLSSRREHELSREAQRAR